jgi:hypothetical protein
MDQTLVDAYMDELMQLSHAPNAATLEIDDYIAVAIIGQIQLASRHPENTGWNRDQAIVVAKELQKLFNPESAIAKVLELGWSQTFDVTVPSEQRIEKRFREIGQIVLEDLNNQDPDGRWEFVTDDDGENDDF